MANLIKIHSEIFLREDIRNILRAIDMANAATSAHFEAAQAELAAYHAGFTAAVQAVAAAFDVSVEPRLPQPARALPPAASDAEWLIGTPDRQSGASAT